MIRILLLGLVFAAGCRVDLNDPGTEPRADEFYFPSGLVLDPTQPYLYVSNGNSDLRFGGGTLMMVDLGRFHRAIDEFRANPSPRACAETLRGPADKPDPDYCCWDPFDPSMVDCDERPFIVSASTIKIGNFAGNMKLQQRGPDRRRIFVGVRGDPSVTWVDVDLQRPLDKPGVLGCVDDVSALERRPAGSPPPGCDGSHLVQTFTCGDEPICTKNVSQIPGEPFGMALDQGKLSSGAEYARLLVTHLTSGEVSLIDVLGAPFIQHVSAPFFTPDQQMRRGAFALAPQRAGDPATPWYLTSNLQAVVATFRVAEIGVIVPSVNFTVAGSFPVGIDVRDIAFEPGGNRAFLTHNNPPSVIVLDTRILPEVSPSTPANQVVDLINTCQVPSNLGVRRVTVPGAPGTPPRVQTRLHVVCFLSNQMMIIDPDIPAVVETLVLGRGPNDVVFDERNLRAYVTNFSEWTVGVINLQPGHERENRMEARLGIAQPPPRL